MENPVRELMYRARVAMGSPTFYNGIPALLIRMADNGENEKNRRIVRMKNAPVGRVLQSNDDGTVTVLFKAEEVVDFLSSQGINA